MSDHQDQKLDEMLRSRRMEPARPDLAERIILRAQAIPQNQMDAPMQWLRRLFAEFHLPQPAYVLAGALVIGLVIGFNAGVDVTPDTADGGQIQSFLYADEDDL